MGTTGHAESVQVTFDESIIPANIILDLFFFVHDPTTINQQGHDIGTQYRSALFYGDDVQKKLFQSAIERAKKHWGNSIVTEITPLGEFYPAEDYHQDYFNKNPGNGYCSVVIQPKITKARKEYERWLIKE